MQGEKTVFCKIGLLSPLFPKNFKKLRGFDVKLFSLNYVNCSFLIFCSFFKHYNKFAKIQDFHIKCPNSQLPAIDLSAPEKAIGTNTIECIKSGTVLGNAAMLDGMASRLEKELGKVIKTTIATGGLSKEIIDCCEREIVYNKNLILEGLLVIYKKNRS